MATDASESGGLFQRRLVAFLLGDQLHFYIGPHPGVVSSCRQLLDVIFGLGCDVGRIAEEFHQAITGGLAGPLLEEFSRSFRGSQLPWRKKSESCWRQGQALENEMACLKQANFHFCPQGNMPNLQRYRTASQRALLKDLELLDELQPSTSEVKEDAAEGDAAPPQPENTPPAVESTSGLTAVVGEPGPPESSSESENQVASGEDSTDGEGEEAA